MSILFRPILIVVFLLGAVAAGAFLTYPKYVQLKEVLYALQVARDELRSVRERYEKLEKLRDQLRQYESALKKIDTALPAQFSLPAYFANLQGITAENGMVITEMSMPKIAPYPGNPSLREAEFDLPVSGSYTALKNLLGSLYRSAKLIDVKSVSFSAPAQGDLFEFKIGVRTYSY
jgi:Tfp pilus assembly protein PilO